MARILVDPVSRLEGHLKIEAEVSGGKVTDAWASGTLFRGIELILQGRDPRDAFHITQRICGVCPTNHGHASSMSVEDAIGLKVTDNARLARNIIEGAQWVHSHILWFYHLTAVDYVDVVSALKAKPANPEQKAVQDKVKNLVDTGQLGPFANGYWGHPAYKLTPELNLLAVTHYIEALERQAQAANLSAILSGIMPMNKATPPGGYVGQPTLEQLNHLQSECQDLQAWVNDVYVADVLAIAPFYLDAAKLGKGPGNYLAYGCFDDKSMNMEDRLLPPGVIMNGALKLLKFDPEKIEEEVARSWYDGDTRKPADGETKPNFTKYDTNAKYSWLKAPRYEGNPMEVGPLSRVLVAYLAGRKEIKTEVDGALSALGVPGQIPLLESVLGRIAARAIETKVIIGQMLGWADELYKNISSGKNDNFIEPDINKDGKGAGLWEGPRGALGHWCDIKGGKLANYQAVVPTTWNCSPRDSKDVKGPTEQALVGTPVADPAKPLEILRVVHSFDPCIACAVHIIDTDKKEIHKFKVG